MFFMCCLTYNQSLALTGTATPADYGLIHCIIHMIGARLCVCVCFLCDLMYVCAFVCVQVCVCVGQ